MVANCATISGGHVPLPFLLLMSATMKRNGRVLGTMCTIMLVSHFMQIYWIVQPESGDMGSGRWCRRFPGSGSIFPSCCCWAGCAARCSSAIFRKVGTVPGDGSAPGRSPIGRACGRDRACRCGVNCAMRDASNNITLQDALKIGIGVAGALAGVLLIVVLLGIALKYTFVEPTVAGGLSDAQRFELLAKARAEDERLTTTYGWMDKGKGVVRLPVEVAMQKLIEERNQ